VATASCTNFGSRSPLTAMPKLYLELRPSLAHSCATALSEKPVVSISVMNWRSTDDGISRTPDPANRPRATVLEYAKEVLSMLSDSHRDKDAASFSDAASKSFSSAGVSVTLKASCTDPWTLLRLPFGRQDGPWVTFLSVTVLAPTAKFAVRARTVSSLRKKLGGLNREASSHYTLVVVQVGNKESSCLGSSRTRCTRLGSGSVPTRRVLERACCW
jgi:hypothetical protein